MPELKDLQEFEKTLVALTDEENWRNNRGEYIEYPELDSQVTSPSIRELPKEDLTDSFLDMNESVDLSKELDGVIDDSSLDSGINNLQAGDIAGSKVFDLDDLPSLDNLHESDQLFEEDQGIPAEDEFQATSILEPLDTADLVTIDGVPAALDVEHSFSIEDLGLQNDRSTPAKKPQVAESSYKKEITFEELVFDESDYELMHSHLASLPRNLRLTLLQILSNEESSPSIIALLTAMLIDEASPRALADEVRLLTGETVVIPHSYQRRTGQAFLNKQNGFFTLFWQMVLPFWAKVLAVSMLTSIIFLAIFHLVYRPVYAHHLYKKGYKMMKLNRYVKAEQFFGAAYQGWILFSIPNPAKLWQNAVADTYHFYVAGVKSESWFYKYIDIYVKNKAFYEATSKYDSLVLLYPKSKRATLSYGYYESVQRSQYDNAEKIYVRYLTDINAHDRDVMLARGNNFLAWAEFDVTKYAQARTVYANLLKKHGLDWNLLQQELLYAIRQNSKEDVDKLRKYFDLKPKKYVDPSIFAELGQWLFDKGQYENARVAFRRALKYDPVNALALYHMARYYARFNDYQSEESMLNSAHMALDKKAPHNIKQTEMMIDIYRRLAMVEERKQDLPLAEEYYLKSLKIYKEALVAKILHPAERFGRVYEQLASLYYKQTNYQAAQIYLQGALENAYDSPLIQYKVGYIHYIQENYNEALQHLLKAYEQMDEDYNVLFAYATVLAQDGATGVAQGIYEQLREYLEGAKVDNIESALENSKAQQALTHVLMKTYNNLGVLAYQQSLSNKNSQDYVEQSFDYFNQALGYWDILSRHPETMERSVDYTLPQKNMSLIERNVVDLKYLVLYDDLPKYPFDS